MSISDFFRFSTYRTSIIKGYSSAKSFCGSSNHWYSGICLLWLIDQVYDIFPLGGDHIAREMASFKDRFLFVLIACRIIFAIRVALKKQTWIKF